MRILFLSAEHAATRGTGGVGSYIATITGALRERGHEVHVLSCLAEASSLDVVEDGVTRHVRPLLRLRGLGRLTPGEQTQRRIRLALSNYHYSRALGRFDAVEAPDWQAEGLLFAVLRPRLLVTHLHTPHSVLEEFGDAASSRDDRAADRLERWTVRRSAAITCPSQLLVDHLRAKGWLGDRDVHIIRYPVEWRRFVASAAVGPSASVLVVGRIERRKAPERVVDAVAELNRCGITARAVLVGRGSGTRDGIPYADWLEGYAQAVEADIEFAGERMWGELPDAYAQCRVVCVPSEFESFSMAAAEGMAAGRPVVLSRTVGAAELLGDDPDRQVVGTESGQLVAALERFLTDANAAATVGLRNREILAAACDPLTIADQRARLYRIPDSPTRPPHLLGAGHG